MREQEDTAFRKLKLDGSLVWNDQPSGNRASSPEPAAQGAEQDRDQCMYAGILSRYPLNKERPFDSRLSHTRGRAQKNVWRRRVDT